MSDLTPTLPSRIAELSDEHGGLRALARSIRCDAGYLSRLASGSRVRPSKALLSRLGLREVVTYERVKP